MIKALRQIYTGFRTDSSNGSRRGEKSCRYYVKDYQYCGKKVSGAFRYGAMDEGIFSGIFREYRLEAISQSLAGREATIVDIGGHIGGFSVIAASLLPQAKVQVYEYISDNVRMIQTNMLLNEVQNQIQVFNVAVGDRSDQVVPNKTFDDLDANAPRKKRANTGGNCIADAATSQGSCENGIPTLAAKEILAPLEQVDILKVDCEGSEFKILFSLDASDYKKIKMITGEIHHMSNHYNESQTNGHLWSGPELLDYLRQFYHQVEVQSQANPESDYLQIFTACDPK
ncbi:FkbM family methyltransferase [Blastopirellula marina]|uniref:Methyltransferase FkbM domain-containing protein n=1 Tax=Blastopirellula marina DSM 3645 TaxID=314230 RepID=A4A149_9BACT|nr:FkbM family methyltransferase [Blastopirellula marina]EAQ77509.1 hypothetical protein DSM3645_06599 [Blastopirellula marina DSM 3645]